MWIFQTCSMNDQVKEDKIGRAYSTNGEKRNAYRILVGKPESKTSLGRAIAQAVSRWLPTAAARVRAWVWSSGICGGQSGAGAGFLRVLRFPLPIHSTKFSIFTITRVKYDRPRINGRRAEWTQCGLHPPLSKLKKKGKAILVTDRGCQ
jgi:hypothetical protein